MVRRLGLGKNNHLTYASLALNPRKLSLNVITLKSYYTIVIAYTNTRAYISVIVYISVKVYTSEIPSTSVTELC